MARVTLIEEAAHPELAEAIARIRSGRRGTLSAIYRLMLHSPAAALAWNQQNSALRWDTLLDGATREQVILRVGALTGCDYVVRVHENVYGPEEGLTAAQVAELLRVDAQWDDDSPAAVLFEPSARAVLAWTDAMTREVQVPDALFERLGAHFDERRIVEITLLAASYNMLTRVLVALGAEPEALPPRKG
jgi:4-carboxymuconolactone decarboxylase